MPTLSDDDIRHIAKLARLQVNEAEVKKFSKELSSILIFFEQLNELQTNDVPATAQVTGLENTLREDIVENPPATTEELLGCSPLPVLNNHIETFSAH